MALNTSLVGKYRIVAKDFNDNTIAELISKHTTELGGSGSATAETDPQKMVKIKAGGALELKEDDKILIEFMPEASKTGATTTDVRTYRVPIRYKNLRTGVVFEKTLTWTDFDHLIAAAVDNVWVADRWYGMDEWVVPAQSAVKLGIFVQDARVDSCLNLHHALEV